MFSDFASSDERERDKRAFRRLCSLRTARLAGYFDEPVLERGEWPNEPAPAGMTDGEFDEYLAQQPGLSEAIDALIALGKWRRNGWDYESDEGFRGRKT